MGMVNGLMITKGKMAPFIATLATMTIFRGLTLVYTNGNPITGLGDNLLFQLFGRGYLLGIPVPAITMLITFMILWIVLHKTAFGRKTYAIGGNEKASIISGIKVNRVKIMIYSLTGMLICSGRCNSDIAFEFSATNGRYILRAGCNRDSCDGWYKSCWRTRTHRWYTDRCSDYRRVE